MVKRPSLANCSWPSSQGPYDRLAWGKGCCYPTTTVQAQSRAICCMLHDQTVSIEKVGEVFRVTKARSTQTREELMVSHANGRNSCQLTTNPICTCRRVPESTNNLSKKVMLLHMKREMMFVWDLPALENQVLATAPSAARAKTSAEDSENLIFSASTVAISVRLWVRYDRYDGKVFDCFPMLGGWRWKLLVGWDWWVWKRNEWRLARVTGKHSQEATNAND